MCKTLMEAGGGYLRHGFCLCFVRVPWVRCRLKGGFQEVLGELQMCFVCFFLGQSLQVSAAPWFGPRRHCNAEAGFPQTLCSASGV